MTELITDHAYERGPYGRCAAGSPPCNKRKSSHDNGPVPGPVVSPLRLESTARTQTTSVEAPLRVPGSEVVEPFPDQTSFPPGVADLDRLQREIEQARLIEKPGLPVYFRLKRGLGKAGDETAIKWPSDWPLPRVGESIQWATRESGRVKDIVYDVDRKRLILVCE